MPSPIRRFNRKILIVCLALLTLALAAALTAACGGGGELGEGGDPLSIVAGDAFEIEIYDVKTYQEQDLPDELREGFDSMQEDFQRFGIDFEDVDQFVTVLVDCCAYRKVGRVGDTRLFVFDGRIDLDAIRGKLEEEGFASRMSGEYETWEKQVLNEKFRRLDQFAAAFLTEEGYVLMGDTDAVRETLYEQSRAGSDESDSAMQQVLTRVGDKWKETGRLDAQTQNTVNTYCASDVQYRMNCQATAYHTSFAETPMKTVITTLYRTGEDAQSESDNLEKNFEESDKYEPVDVEIVDLNVDGWFVDATVHHDSPLWRKWSYIY